LDGILFQESGGHIFVRVLSVFLLKQNKELGRIKPCLTSFEGVV
jgi:hypothetical protein